MKQKQILNLILLTIIGLFININCHANEHRNTTSLADLIQRGLVHLDISGLGGYQEDCVNFKIGNNTNDSLYGYVEPGRRLISKDGGEQDILIVKELEFALAPSETKDISGYGFCCQSHNSAPSEDSGFTLGKMTNENWQLLAKKIDQGEYPPSAIQNAVWVLSDDHDIRSIPAFGDDNTTDLRQSVADILGIEIPWYSFLYEQDSTDIFTGVANRLFAEVTYTVPRRTMISGQIHDADGKLVHTFPSYHTSKGTHHYHLDVPLDEFENGDYTFTILEDFGVLNFQKEFKLGDDIIEETIMHDANEDDISY